MTNTSGRKDSHKSNRPSHLDSDDYLPDFIRATTRHTRPPRLGTFNAGMQISQRRPDHEPDTRIDKFTFGMVLAILLGICIPLIFFPEQGKEWVGIARNFVTTNFGFAYLTFGVLAMMFVIYIIFSDIGKIKLGRPEDTPEFGDASWAAMLFCGGIGASILYWGLIEWAYYYQGPPFNIAAGSPDAIRWATTYGIFHWGPVAWAIYLVPAVPIAYFYYVRQTPVLKVSQTLMPLLGEKLASSNWAKMLDVLFVFGMVGGGATTLGLASPLINEGLYNLFGLPRNITMQLAVLFVTTMIFAYSAYQGLKGGIQKLSNINFYLAVAFLLFILVTGPTVFIFNTGLEALGRSLTEMPRMMTYIEPFKDFGSFGFEHTTFPQDWTVFYWAWWLVFAPTIGLFIAKISRGRTIQNMVVGSMFYGSLGCAMFMIILGNYGLYLQLTGTVDVVSILNNETATAAIFAILNSLPMSYLVISVFTFLAIIFTATTFDSISYILASVVQVEVDDEPHRWNRLFWAFTLCLLPAILMFLGDLATLQTASIIAGAPLIIILSMMMLSLIKAARYDLHYQPDYNLKTIHIEELAENAPWEEGETSEAPEGSVLAQQEEWETMIEDEEAQLAEEEKQDELDKDSDK
ncbi:BCCT family transporter [Psychrobacter sp. YP14]|uniref:BCCT family transporter n=3 Tax=Psychrobacter TaxID=497 RepID=A0A844M1C9_9GAMM|nr:MULTISPECIES: BCCT family transporter [Psychrobacter]AWT48077.1 BCCT family transporter [Psychrobacter sp. YP14]MUG32490.1 BCCT family transporter [Psychrobacter sanguinis]